MNKNIAVIEQGGVATRLQSRVDAITGILNTIGNNWLKLGEELKLIRDEGDYAGTFEEFVKTTFGKTRGWANQFIQGFEARKSLPEHIRHDIQNPRQALALAAVPAVKREMVVQGVKDSGKAPTAKAIREEAAKQKAVDADVEELDELGKKIPTDIVSEWNRAKEESKWARNSIDEVARWFRDGLGDGADKRRDPIFRAVALSNKKLFDDIKRQVAMVEPYALCPTCKGTKRECNRCKGTGFISKFELEHVEKKDSKKK